MYNVIVKHNFFTYISLGAVKFILCLPFSHWIKAEDNNTKPNT